MPGQPRAHTEWVVQVVAGGTPEEAEAAARQARRMVAQWILRDTGGIPTPPRAPGEEDSR